MKKSEALAILAIANTIRDRISESSERSLTGNIYCMAEHDYEWSVRLKKGRWLLTSLNDNESEELLMPSDFKDRVEKLINI